MLRTCALLGGNNDSTAEMEKHPMANELIWSPTVFIVGQTKWNEDEFDAWLDFNDEEIAEGLNELPLDNANTPIARLWRDVNEDDAVDRMIEFAGRHCYRAWGKGRDRKEYIRNIIDMEHGSVLEHSTFNIAMQGVSRSLSLELVRHRVGVAISQESQRYVDASMINFVVPPLMVQLAGGTALWIDPANGREGTHPLIVSFERKTDHALSGYKELQAVLKANLDQSNSSLSPVKRDTMATKRANEAARGLLPNAAETRLTWTANVRLLRHFFFLRGGTGADLEIRRLAVALLERLQDRTSAFDDMTVNYGVEHSYGVGVIQAR